MLEVQCKECGIPRPIGEFYPSHRLEKYQNGHLDICKHCLRGLVNNDPNSFQWVLEEIDIPWAPEYWDRQMYYHPNSWNLGRYISYMHLMSFRKFRYSDSYLFTKKEEFDG